MDTAKNSSVQERSAHDSSSQAPSERRAPASRLHPRNAAGQGQQTLVDLMYDGFYALFLMQNGAEPGGADALAEHMAQFLGEVDRHARQQQLNLDDVWSAKYAFCAAVDEIILRSQYGLRHEWERRPLQLRLFGDQLAGEHFFEKLEELRARGSAHLQSLEVFHMCLLLGFQGRYALDGVDKLNYMTVRLGEEIARMRGKNRAFAPHVERPDHIVNKLRGDVSLWVLTVLFTLAGLGAYTAFRTSLDAHVTMAMKDTGQSISMPPPPASVTITLP